MKIIKNPAFMFILGVVTCTITTVLASSLIASNISYTPQDKTWGVDNVGAAIDSLKLSKTSDNYSTDEKVVGTWIDGKPLYQKTVPVTLPSENGSNTPHGISNFGSLVDMTLIWYDTSDKRWNIGTRYYSGGYGIGFESFSINETNIFISNIPNNINWASRTSNAYVTIKYTKTTD